MEAFSKSKKQIKNYKVTDTWPIIKGVLFIIALPVVYLISIGIIVNGEVITLNKTMIITIFIIDLLFVIRIKCLSGGVYFNNKKQYISFYGGGVSPRNMFSVINPKFILQYFLRHTVKYDEIRMIDTDEEFHKHKRIVGGQERVSFSKNYFLKINGNFGAVKIRFKSEDKRDEAYSYIRNIVNAGEPIIIE